MTPAMTEMRTALVGAFIVAIGPISIALYTPAMPALVAAFGTTVSAVKLTVTVYFLGFASAQLVCGPLSDAYGRRPVALGFFIVYLVGSVIAALAPTIAWLIVGRALQGVGAAAGVAISRAIVRDQFVGQSSARIMNLIGLMLAIGPALSPALGGLMLTTLGWQSIFAVMVACGLAVVAVLAVAVPETNPAPDPALARPGQILRSYATLLSDRRFVRPGLVLGLALGGVYTLTVLLPFVMIERVGLTPTQFGLAMLAQTGSYMTGAAITAQLLRHFGAMRLVPIGLAIILTAGVLIGIAPRLLPVSFYTVMGPVALWAFGIALVMPGATTGALAGFAHIAGAASALTGFMQIGGGLIGSAIAALLFGDPFTAMTVILPAMALIAALVHVGLSPAPPRSGAANEVEDTADAVASAEKAAEEPPVDGRVGEGAPKVRRRA